MTAAASHKASPERPVRVPFRERLSCTIAEAAEASGLGRASIYRLIDAGRLDALLITVRAGGKGRRLVRVPSLLRLIEGAPEGQP